MLCMYIVATYSGGIYCASTFLFFFLLSLSPDFSFFSTFLFDLLYFLPISLSFLLSISLLSYSISKQCFFFWYFWKSKMLLKKKIKEYNLVENRLKTDLKIRVQIHIKVFGHIRDCVLVNTSDQRPMGFIFSLYGPTLWYC